MQHQIFLHKLLLKAKNLNALLRPFYSVFRYSKLYHHGNYKYLYGINNKSSGVSVVRMYVTTCVTNKLQMNPVHLQQFLPNLHN